MVVGPRGVCEHSPVYINDKEIEWVSNFRHLDFHVNNKNQLVHSHCCNVCRGPAADVLPASSLILQCPEAILSLYSKATVDFVTRCGIGVWCGNLPMQAKARFATSCQHVLQTSRICNLVWNWCVVWESSHASQSKVCYILSTRAPNS